MVVILTGKGRDAIMADELRKMSIFVHCYRRYTYVVVCCCVDPRAWSTNVESPRRRILVGSISLFFASGFGTTAGAYQTYPRWYIVGDTGLFSRYAILCSAVRILGRDWSGLTTDMSKWVLLIKMSCESCLPHGALGCLGTMPRLAVRGILLHFIRVWRTHCIAWDTTLDGRALEER